MTIEKLNIAAVDSSYKLSDRPFLEFGIEIGNGMRLIGRLFLINSCNANVGISNIRALVASNFALI